MGGQKATSRGHLWGHWATVSRHNAHASRAPPVFRKIYTHQPPLPPHSPSHSPSAPCSLSPFARYSKSSNLAITAQGNLYGQTQSLSFSLLADASERLLSATCRRSCFLYFLYDLCWRVSTFLIQILTYYLASLISYCSWVAPGLRLIMTSWTSLSSKDHLLIVSPSYDSLLTPYQENLGQSTVDKDLILSQLFISVIFIDRAENPTASGVMSID